MYREKAIKLLDRLRSFNCYEKTEYLTDFESQKIIESIVNECKSTILIQQGNQISGRRYESSFTINSITSIVNELLANSTKISRQTMNKLLFENGAFAGIDLDANMYKGINSETGRFEAHISNIYIDENEIEASNYREKLTEIIKKYVKDFLLYNSELKKQYLSSINGFRIMIEMLFHRRYPITRFEKDYMKLLSDFTGITNEEVLLQNARYKVGQITSPKYINTVLDSIKNGTAISILGEKSDEFIYLIRQISEEICEQMINIPNLNIAFKDLNQIFKDIEAQLTAYSTVLIGKSPKQIEDEIKKINLLSVTDEKGQYIDANGYRSVDVAIGNNIKLVSKEDVPLAMSQFAKGVFDFVNSPATISDEEYVKKATMLMYRFIRIHPFPDSNGRTSRAFLNMLTLNRNILVSFDKREKDRFLIISNSIHEKLDEKYVECLCHNSSMAEKMEAENIRELEAFVLRNSTLNDIVNNYVDKDKGQLDISK